jgi:predicted nuclease with TOPRIM domain
MDMVVPVIGIGAIILFVVVGIVVVRVLTAKLAHPEPRSSTVDSSERDQMLEQVHVRLGEVEQLKQRMSELEERVDFAERLLTKQREGQRLGPSQDEPRR